MTSKLTLIKSKIKMMGLKNSVEETCTISHSPKESPWKSYASVGDFKYPVQEVLDHPTEQDVDEKKQEPEKDVNRQEIIDDAPSRDTESLKPIKEGKWEEVSSIKNGKTKRRRRKRRRKCQIKDPGKVSLSPQISNKINGLGMLFLGAVVFTSLITSRASGTIIPPTTIQWERQWFCAESNLTLMNQPLTINKDTENFCNLPAMNTTATVDCHDSSRAHLVNSTCLLLETKVTRELEKSMWHLEHGNGYRGKTIRAKPGGTFSEKVTAMPIYDNVMTTPARNLTIKTTGTVRVFVKIAAVALVVIILIYLGSTHKTRDSRPQAEGGLLLEKDKSKVSHPDASGHLGRSNGDVIHKNGTVEGPCEESGADEMIKKPLNMDSLNIKCPSSEDQKQHNSNI
ncbi:uncharacterized protein O3C94_014899 isoform 1-T3 [Discoglossus pictus]